MINRVFFPFLIILLVSCGSVATVRPLEPEERALSFSVGGPVAEVPGIANLPLPYSVLRYRWGILNRLEGHIGVHTTMAFFGTLGVDVGLSYLLLDQKGWRPAICVGVNPTAWINPFNRDGVGARPEAEAAASWYLSPRLLFYTGAQAFFQLEEPYVPWAALIGTEVRVGKAIGLGVEVKWYATLEDSDFRVVGFPLSPADQGALGAVVGINLYPGGANE
jgi:hypothetical protein